VLSSLLSPLRLGPVELQNRIVSTAHQTTLVHDHLPTDDFVAYHEARALGGAGLIVLEATAPHPSGILTAHELAGFLPEMVEAYRRVGDAVQPHGTRLFVQLLHGGREQISGPPRAPALAPSAIPSQRFRVTPRALRAHEIEEIVEAFGDAARLAAGGGLDGVEISAAHRYLIAQFFDPELNRRDDEWAEPSRFLLAVVRAAREAAPGLCVGVRLSADSEPAQRMAPLLDGEVDYLSIALGESPSYLGSTLIVPPPPLSDNAIVPHADPFRVGLPLIATSRVVDVNEADAIVASGAADALGMTRALITDPDLPAKARAGRTHEITRCIGCQACIAHYHADDAIRCAITPVSYTH
jgi:2,4-dienoyl-CoA reductase-like NADH-dependent reductase (Old Yellow Enzyme family)